MVVSIIGASVSMVLGFMAVFFPKKTEAFVSLSSNSIEGLSEVRATYGGFFIGISGYALYSQAHAAFLTIGIGWLAAAFVRLITLFTGSWSPKNLGGVAFEAVIGILCIWNSIM